MDATYIDLTVRLSLALILGGAIGIEREYRAKEAVLGAFGFRRSSKTRFNSISGA